MPRERIRGVGNPARAFATGDPELARACGVGAASPAPVIIHLAKIPATSDPTLTRAYGLCRA
jgi:hypothetical protein